MLIIIFVAVHWYLSLFCQTFFHHRYAAHKMYDMSRASEKFFFILSYITQGSSYLSPYAYGVMHRMHHAYADTEKDVHSPKHDKNLFKMMWRTKDVYMDLQSGKTQVEDRFKKEVPQWNALDNLAHGWASRLAWGTAYTLFYIYANPAWYVYLLLPMHYIMGPVHGAIINWFAHKYGYTNFKVNDTSKNMFPLDLIMMGEGLHNNHHKLGSRPNFAVKWYEFDPTYPVIKFLELIGVIKMRNLKSQEAIAQISGF